MDAATGAAPADDRAPCLHDGAASRMPQMEFGKMKSDLARQRRHAVSEVCKLGAVDCNTAQEWDRWCLSTALTPPPVSLAAWHDSLGGTTVVTSQSVSDGGGFQGDLVFAVGDMINLAAESAGRGIPTAVLNMANARTPGGGFLGGSRAQEEQLCHRSDLYPRLKVACSRGAYPLQNGVALLTPRVTLRLCDRAAHFAALAQPPLLAVVTAAAERYKNEGAARRDAALTDSLEATWRGVLEAARSSGAHHLVLSAIGSGAFSNPPDVVAAALVGALRACAPGAALCRVTVCVLDDHNSRDNVARFRSVMLQAGALEEVATDEPAGETC